jgi:hypothetical protein
MLIFRRGTPLTTKTSGLISLLCGGLFTLHTVQAKPPIEEFADPSLPDIASVNYVPGKAPFILYNPILCKQAGPELCQFYRYHEYGHIALRHYERNDISVKEKESEADRWAAQRAPHHVVMTAWRFFSSGGGSTPVHGDGATRAARLLSARNLLVFAGKPHDYNGREPVPLSFGALAL